MSGMTSQPLGLCGLRRRARSLLVGALLLTALIGVTAPSTAGADPIQSLNVRSEAKSGVHATLQNNVLKITNSTSNFWVHEVDGNSPGSDLMMADSLKTPVVCGLSPPGVVVGTDFVCGFFNSNAMDTPPYARPPGETIRLRLRDTAGLTRVDVYMVDADCVNETRPVVPFRYNQKLVPGLTWPPAAKLDACARQALGVPTLTETGAGNGKVGLTINGASAHWATRVFGGHSRKAVRKASSGKTVAKIPPGPKHYPPFQNAILSLAPSVKFLRAAWTKKGEKPILGPILKVRR
jgi:hypothetical protein